MDFCIQLSAYYPDKNYGGKQLYQDMLEQAVLADQCGYEAVSITEHHLISILLMPAPLQFAVKIASMTDQVKILTSVVVLPIHDMRVYAGELICADIFTDHRLMLGVGRGAFEFESSRFDVPLDISREKFDESLNVLQALLSHEEVSWKGKYYNFEALTVMPRPENKLPIMMGVVSPSAIYHCAKRGFHIQTTPLSGTHQHMLDQVEAFNTGKAENTENDDDLSLSLSRVTFLSNDKKDRERIISQAHHYYGQFDNVYTGPGIVENGMIKPIPRNVPISQTKNNLLIAGKDEMIDTLSQYAEAGVDRFIMNINFGICQQETLDCIQRFSEDIMPTFTKASVVSKSLGVVK